MDLAPVVAALASVGVRVSGSTPNNNIQGDSSRACPTGLAGPEPSGTLNDPGQHFHQAPAFRPEHGLLSEAARGYLQRQEWENYGRIHAKTKRRHQNPSNDGLEFFLNDTPEQNPIVHQKHILIKIIVIFRFYKSRNSYA